MEELLCGLLKLFSILFLVLGLNPGPCVCQACTSSCNPSMLLATRIPDESWQVLFTCFFPPTYSVPLQAPPGMETPLDVLSRAASLVHADDEKRESSYLYLVPPMPSSNYLLLCLVS